jgi:uncharacterized protein (DUF2267 family)
VVRLCESITIFGEDRAIQHAHCGLAGNLVTCNTLYQTRKPEIVEGRMSTGVDVFDSTIQKTISLLNDICLEFGWPEERRFQAYKALRSVLHEIRDRLTVTECANFAAQLPMLVRGFYYEGWKPESVPKKVHRQEFLDEIQRTFQLAVDGGPARLVDGVIRALSAHMEAHVIDRIKQEFPADLKSLLDPAA